MSDVIVNTDINKLPPQLRQFISQVPYATSVGLNQTAYKVQQHIRTKTLPSDLTLRNRWTQAGIKYNKSSKTNLVAEVGSQDWYTAKLITGGSRTAKVGIKYKGKSYLFVPSKEAKTKTGKIRKLDRVGKKAFIINKNGTLLLVRRKTKRRYPLVYLGILTPKTNYKTKTLDWEKGHEQLIPKTFRREFTKAMVKAARTAR